MDNKILILILITFFSLSNAIADSHDATTEQDILKKQKKLTKK